MAGNTFKCHVRPYYLSLTFKQLLQEGGEKVCVRASSCCALEHLNLHQKPAPLTGALQARWDVDNNEMTVVIPKATPGQHFDNLYMLTQLLTQVRVHREGGVEGK